jgi:hypothetical protein
MSKPVINSAFHPRAIATTLVAIVLVIGFASCLFAVCAAGEPVLSAAAPAPPAQQAWQMEFDDLCSKTQDAMTFSTGELAALVQRCDALLPRIEKLDDTQKRVYMGRLRMCRGLYAYVLDSKKLDSTKNDKK